MQKGTHYIEFFVYGFIGGEYVPIHMEPIREEWEDDDAHRLWMFVEKLSNDGRLQDIYMSADWETASNAMSHNIARLSCRYPDGSVRVITPGTHVFCRSLITNIMDGNLPLPSGWQSHSLRDLMNVFTMTSDTRLNNMDRERGRQVECIRSVLMHEGESMYGTRLIIKLRELLGFRSAFNRIWMLDFPEIFHGECVDSEDMFLYLYSMTYVANPVKKSTYYKERITYFLKLWYHSREGLDIKLLLDGEPEPVIEGVTQVLNKGTIEIVY